MSIYMVRAGDNGPVKIGISKNPERRMRTLQSSHYAKLRIIRLIPDIVASERWLHTFFAHRRLHGEWFEFDDLMLTIQQPPTAAAKIVSPADIECVATDRGLSIIAMCRRADLNPGVFHRWRAGKNLPSIGTVQKMIDAIEREERTI